MKQWMCGFLFVSPLKPTDVHQIPECPSVAESFNGIDRCNVTHACTHGTQSLSIDGYNTYVFLANVRSEDRTECFLMKAPMTSSGEQMLNRIIKYIPFRAM